MRPFQIPPVKPNKRRPWGSSYSEDPDYEFPEDQHDDAIPTPPPVPHRAVVKKRAFTAAAQNSGRPTSSSSTYLGDRNVAIDPPEPMPNVENAGQNSHSIPSSLEQTLQAITVEHGDISKECYFESKYAIANMLEGICMVIQDIEGKVIEQLNVESLLEYDMFLENAEKMNFNVKWLRLQLNELLEAVKSFIEAKEADREKTELVGNIEVAKEDIQGRKADLERLISFVREREKELDLWTHQKEMLSVKIAGLKTSHQSFLGKPINLFLRN